MGHVSGSWPRPFAVGVLASDGGRRRRERLDLALDAYKLGYFLLDTVEVHDRAGYAVAEALAARTDADAFVVRGDVDLPRLERAAADLRMRVCRSAP